MKCPKDIESLYVTITPYKLTTRGIRPQFYPLLGMLTSTKSEFEETIGEFAFEMNNIGKLLSIYTTKLKWMMMAKE